MLPKLLFSELSWTVNGYVNFPRDLYHLLAMGTTPWLLHCCSFRDRGSEFQRASKWSAGLSVLGLSWCGECRPGVMGCCPGIPRENLGSKNPIVMKWGF